MIVFKCKMCGGDLRIDENSTTAVCEYCGTEQTLPKLSEERSVNLYDRANHFRRNSEFDKAIAIYEQILNEDSSDAEAYWSLVLCRYGIVYVEDPNTKVMVPTVNRAQYTSIFDDDNFRLALKYADAHQRKLYEHEADVINSIQKRILEVSQKEEPFDVFICYKETDSNNERTKDSVIANDLYYELKEEGFKVFFSRITLEDKLGSEYEPYIFAALNSSKVMVVVGTRPEYFNAPWVRNEWSRYLSLIKNGAKKTLIPAYRDMDPYDLPSEFSHLQALDMSKLGFVQDLVRGIKKINGPNQSVRERRVEFDYYSNQEYPLLERTFMCIEEGDYDKATELIDKVLNINPKSSKAYIAQLLIKLNLKREEDLADLNADLKEHLEFTKAQKFADEAYSSTLERYYWSALFPSLKRDAFERRRQAEKEMGKALYCISEKTDVLRKEDIFCGFCALYDDSINLFALEPNSTIGLEESYILQCKEDKKRSVCKVSKKAIGLLHSEGEFYLELLNNTVNHLREYSQDKDCSMLFEEAMGIVQELYTRAIRFLNENKNKRDLEVSFVLLTYLTWYSDASEKLIESEKALANIIKESFLITVKSNSDEQGICCYTSYVLSVFDNSLLANSSLVMESIKIISGQYVHYLVEQKDKERLKQTIVFLSTLSNPLFDDVRKEAEIAFADAFEKDFLVVLKSNYSGWDTGYSYYTSYVAPILDSPVLLSSPFAMRAVDEVSRQFVHYLINQNEKENLKRIIVFLSKNLWTLSDVRKDAEKALADAIVKEFSSSPKTFTQSFDGSKQSIDFYLSYVNPFVDNPVFSNSHYIMQAVGKISEFFRDSCFESIEARYQEAKNFSANNFKNKESQNKAASMFDAISDYKDSLLREESCRRISKFLNNKSENEKSLHTVEAKIRQEKKSYNVTKFFCISAFLCWFIAFAVGFAGFGFFNANFLGILGCFVFLFASIPILLTKKCLKKRKGILALTSYLGEIKQYVQVLNDKIGFLEKSISDDTEMTEKILIDSDGFQLLKLNYEFPMLRLQKLFVDKIPFSNIGEFRRSGTNTPVANIKAALVDAKHYPSVLIEPIINFEKTSL